MSGGNCVTLLFRSLLLLLANSSRIWHRKSVLIYRKIFFNGSTALEALHSFQFPGLFTIGRTPSSSAVEWPARHKASTASTASTVRYLNTISRQHNARNIHALSCIRIHEHSVQVSEDSSCLRPLGYRGRHTGSYPCNSWQYKERTFKGKKKARDFIWIQG
jgi:hypothetical protein